MPGLIRNFAPARKATRRIVFRVRSTLSWPVRLSGALTSTPMECVGVGQSGETIRLTVANALPANETAAQITRRASNETDLVSNILCALQTGGGEASGWMQQCRERSVSKPDLNRVTSTAAERPPTRLYVQRLPVPN